MNEKYIITGLGGHSQILIEILATQKKNIIGATEKNASIKFENSYNIDLLGDDDSILNYEANEIKLVNGIGWIPGNKNIRKSIFDRFVSLGYSFSNVISDSAVVSENSLLHQGTQVFSGAVIQTGCSIGANTIINTQSSIDHHTFIGENCHIAPGAIICGNVKIGNNSFIGAGAIIINNIEISDNCVIGAGAVLKESLSSDIKYS